MLIVGKEKENCHCMVEFEKKMRSKAAAVFMAFGTKGDVYPLAAIAAAFACDQEQYQVIFITRSAHEGLSLSLAKLFPTNPQADQPPPPAAAIFRRPYPHDLRPTIHQLQLAD
ncbi:putative protein isoform X2 [Capsicum annuum]